MQIRQLNASAALVRQVEIGTFSQSTNLPDNLPRFVAVQADAKGNIFALVSESRYTANDAPYEKVNLYKYGSSNSTPMWVKMSEAYSVAGFDLDANGNVFVAQTNINATTGDPTLSYFTRYNTNGVKWYQRNSQVGVIQDIEVADNGDIYVIGEKGLSRYNNGGGLIWTKAIAGCEVAVSPSAIYLLQDVKAVQSILKLNFSGTRIWTRGGDGITFFSNLETDTKGNIYFSSSQIDTSPDAVTRLDSNGNYVWGTTLDFGGEDFAKYGVNGIATYDGTSTYTVGRTLGSVNGVYRGGGSDAFIVRLNAQGQKVWER